jgi:hypothetical protein
MVVLRLWCATAAGRASAASEAYGAGARAVGDVAAVMLEEGP